MKTYYWLNRNRFLSHLRIAAAGTFISAVAAMVLFTTLPASSSPAEEQVLTIAYRVETVYEVDEHTLLFTSTGQGASRLFGSFTVDAIATYTRIPDACDQVSGDIAITTDGGSFRIHEEDLNCPTSYTGDWYVVPGSGTGNFSGASGSGTLIGDGNLTGRLVIRYTGSLSF
jgi:hypothetical protein